MTIRQVPAKKSPIKRYLYDPIKRDLSRKMVILTGPRQIGKTWLSKELSVEFKRPQYLNYDHVDDAGIIHSRSWPVNADMLILDAITFESTAADI